MRVRLHSLHPRQVVHFIQRQPKLSPVTTRARMIAAALLLAIAATAGAQLVVSRINQLPPDAAFRIDDKVITEQQLQQRVRVLESLYGIRPPQDPKGRDQFNRDTAKAIAVSEILKSAARAKGIVITDKAAYDQLGNLIKENYQGDRRAFVKSLGANGISQRTVLDEIKRQLTSAKLFAQVTDGVKPATEHDARNYYNKHKNQMVSPEQRGIRNIVVSTQLEATQIAQRAKNGKDFAELARQHSIDGQTKEKGGYLGVVSADQLEPKYAKVAFAAKPTTVFGPVQTSKGWNIGQVTEVHPAVPLSFQQLKDPLQNKLTNEAKFNTWSNWLTQQIKAANVEYAPDYRPANPDAPPVSDP